MQLKDDELYKPGSEPERGGKPLKLQTYFGYMNKDFS